MGWTLSCFKNDLGWVELISSYKMGEICCTTRSNLPWGHLGQIRCLFPGDMWLCPKRGYPKIQGCIISFLQQYHHADVFFSLHGMAFFWVCPPPFLNNPISYCWLALSDSIAKKTYPMTSPHSIFLQNAWLQAQQATPLSCGGLFPARTCTAAPWLGLQWRPRISGATGDKSVSTIRSKARVLRLWPLDPLEFSGWVEVFSTRGPGDGKGWTPSPWFFRDDRRRLCSSWGWCFFLTWASGVVSWRNG